MDRSYKAEHLLSKRQLKLKIDKYEVTHMGTTILTLHMKRSAMGSHHHPGVKSWGYDSYFHANLKRSAWY